jgi:hypothetical protein
MKNREDDREICAIWSWSCDRRSVGQSASLSWYRATIWNLWPDFTFLRDNCGFLEVEHPLWREDWSVIDSYVCFRASPGQSLLGPRLAELTTIFYCLSWDSTSLKAGTCICIPQEQGSPVILTSTGLSFHRPLRPSGLRWKYSNPPPHGSVCYSQMQLPRF